MLKAIVAVWLVLLVLTGYAPKERLTWLMEVFPVMFAIPLLWFSRNRFPLPRYILIWIFLHGVLLMVGGHYTYAEVPLGFWVRDALGLARNHFDRLGHFMQGFVPALVTREILMRKNAVNGAGWLFFITVTICMAISASYEFVEWAAALILGQGADAFLGTQGDPWDTQWDMFMATIGAATALLLYSGRIKVRRRI